ncbi:MAG: hypothetical protein ABI977_32430, partial [Acidobacteriota bacterium]
SNSITITFSDPPVIVATVTPTELQMGGNATINVTVTDTDGVSQVEFIDRYSHRTLHQTATPTTVAAPVYTYQYTLSNLGPCQYEVEVIATDAHGVKASQTVPFSISSGAADEQYISNGIGVGQAKLFDERSLALMLNSVQAKLNDSDFYKQSDIASAIGKFQGERFESSTLGISVTTTPLPGVTTTTEDKTTTASTGTTTEKKLTETVTRPSVTPTPASPAPTPAAFTAPVSNLSIAPQALLAQQMAMNFELINLRLLLESAVSDRIVTVPVRVGNSAGSVQGVRTRVVTGFQISLDSRREYQDAVAEVEVTIKSPCLTPAPSLVTLLPREDSYNVATISKNSKQFGLGVAVQPISFGLTAQNQKETLYLIQDLDTIAFERAAPLPQSPSPAQSITFGWQFRPVLGQRTVKAGMRQVYAVLALPNDGTSKFDGQVEVRTYWRRYDAKRKAVGPVIETSRSFRRLAGLNVEAGFLAGAALRPKADNIEWQDAGDGKVWVKVKGENFLPGTSVVLGGQKLETASAGLYLSDERNLRFLVEAKQLARLPAPAIVGRFGAQVPLVDAGVESESERVSSSWGIKILKVEVEPSAGPLSQVRVTVTSRRYGRLLDSVKPIVTVGEQAFGFLDHPITAIRSSPATMDLIFVAPTQTIREAGRVVVRRLFWEHDDWSDDLDINDLNFQMPSAFTAAEAITLAATATDVVLAVRGSGFNSSMEVVAGNNPPLTTASTPPVVIRSPALLTFQLPLARFKGLEKIIVSRTGAQPVVLAITPQPPPAPTITKIDPVKVNDEHDVRVEGTNLNSVVKALFKGTELKIVGIDPNGMWLLLRLTKDAVTGTVGKKAIDFVPAAGENVQGTLEVQARS